VISVDAQTSKGNFQDSVKVYTSSYVVHFHDEESLIPADKHLFFGTAHPYKTYFVSVSEFSMLDGEDFYEWKPAANGTKLRLEPMTGDGLRTPLSIPETVETVDGQGMFSLEFHSVLEEAEDKYAFVLDLEEIHFHEGPPVSFPESSKDTNTQFDSGIIHILPGGVEILEMEIENGNPNVVADGFSERVILARAFDRYRNPVPDLTEIAWGLDSPGSIRISDSYFADGVARAIFLAPERTDAMGVDSFTVEAMVAGRRATLTLGKGAADIKLTADKESIDLNDYTQEIELTARITTTEGADVAEGTRVHWSTDNGHLVRMDTIVRDRTIDGATAYATLTVEKGHVGPARIQVGCGDAKAEIVVQFDAGGAAFIRRVTPTAGNELPSHVIAADSSNVINPVPVTIGELDVLVNVPGEIQYVVEAKKQKGSTLLVGFTSSPDTKSPPIPNHEWSSHFEFRSAHGTVNGLARVVIGPDGFGRFSVCSKGTLPMPEYVDDLLPHSKDARIAAQWYAHGNNAGYPAIIGHQIATATRAAAAGVGAIAYGFIFGTPDFEANSLHVAADMAACFMLWGDVRDLMKQSVVFVQGKDVEGWIVGSSLVGIVTTFFPPAWAVKAPTNTIKVVVKSNRGMPIAKLGKEVISRSLILVIEKGPKAAYRYMRNTGIVYGVLLLIEFGMPAQIVDTVMPLVDFMFENDEEDETDD
jgi:hypothetical protein